MERVALTAMALTVIVPFLVGIVEARVKATSAAPG
jgi:hypothetical protein